MQKTDRTLCNQFESEVWLYISDELSDDRKKLWDRHLAECGECSALLRSNREISSFYKENMAEDINDFALERILKNAAEEVSFFQKIKQNIIELHNSYTFGKVVLGSTLVVASLVIMLFSQNQNSVKHLANSLLNWEDTEVVTKIDEISKAILDIDSNPGHSDSEWTQSLKGIETQIDSLKISINN